MSRRMGFALFVLVLFGTAGTAAAYTTLVGTVPNGSDSDLVLVDSATGAATVVGPMGFADIEGLAARPSDGVLFGSMGLSSPNLGSVVTVDPQTGAAALVGPPANMPNGELPALAFSSGGTLYAACELNGAVGVADSICTVDQGTGVISPVIVLTFNSSTLRGIAAIAFDGGGTLYGATGSYFSGGPTLFTLNLSTGVATQVGKIRNASDTQISSGVVGLRFDGSTLYASTADGRILTIDPATAIYSLVGPIGIAGAVQDLAIATLPGPPPTPTLRPGECNVSAPSNPCIPGGGGHRSDCLLEWLVPGSVQLNRKGIQKRKIVCYEGDPECDVDSDLDNKSCTFQASLCINNTDPRLSTCSSTGLLTFEVKRPTLSHADAADTANLQALENEAGTGLGVSVIRDHSIVSLGGLNDQPDVCGPPANVTVPLRTSVSGRVRKGKKRIRVQGTTALALRDTDALVFECRPSTCGDGVVQSNEQCDDHNRVNGDGCNQGCQIEVGAPTATATPGVTTTPTSAPTASSTPTGPTDTPTPVPPTPTVTDTPPPTDTPTLEIPTDTPTPAAPPTDTPTIDPSALGLRIFTIANKPKSHLYSSGLGGGDVAAGLFLSGPLRIVAGVVDANGVAPLYLQQDVVIGLSVSSSDPVCLKLLAAGSSGSIDCDGGTSYDILMTQDSHMGGTPDPAVLTTGLGSDAGAGAATLIVMGSGGQLPPGSSVNDCATASFPPPGPIAFTTANATATVQNADPSSLGIQMDGSVSLSKPGKNFDCNTWSTTDAVGVFATPQIGLGTLVGDTANVIILSDNQAYP